MEKLNSKHKQMVKLKQITKEEDINSIKSILVDIQDATMGINSFELIFASTKARADYLLLLGNNWNNFDLGEEEFNVALKLFQCLKIYWTMAERK